MSEADTRALNELNVDVESLHREEVFTDLRAATIRRLTPVDTEGANDPSRPITYVGETTIVTQLGPLPVSFAIEARTLKEAFAYFPEGVKEAVERLNERAKEMARDEASRIVVPSGVPPGMGGGGLPPGAGGGKIVL